MKQPETEREPRKSFFVRTGDIVIGQHEQRMTMSQERIEELAASLAEEGLINPVTVCRQGDVYVLAIGHRRFAAAKHLGWREIEAFISHEDPEKLQRQIRAENHNRVDLTPVEIADDLYQLIMEDEKTVTQAAAMYHKSEAWIRSHLAITTWPEILIDAVHQKTIAKSAAEQLARITDEDSLEYLLTQAVESGATARTCAAWASSWAAQMPPEEIPQVQAPDQARQVQPMRMVMPCLCCKEEHEPDALAHAYVCVKCHEKIRNHQLEDYR